MMIEEIIPFPHKTCQIPLWVLGRNGCSTEKGDGGKFWSWSVKNECTPRMAKNEVQAHGREESGSSPCLCVARLPAPQPQPAAGGSLPWPRVSEEEPSQGQHAGFAATVAVSHIKTEG